VKAGSQLRDSGVKKGTEKNTAVFIDPTTYTVPERQRPEPWSKATEVLPSAVGTTNTNEADAVLRKRAPAYAVPGQIITYEIVLDNLDAVTRTFSLTDTLPSGARYLSGSATGGLVYDGGTHQLTWRGEIGPGTLGYEVTAVTPIPYVNLGELGADNLCGRFDNCDEASVLFDLQTLYGESVTFYGETLTQLSVLDNGIIYGPEGWSGTACSACPQPLPQPTELNQVMAGLWRDIDTSGGVGAWYGAVLDGLLSNTVDKVFYANWHDAGQFESPLTTSRHAIAVVLDGQSEPAGRIYFIYDDISGRTALTSYGYTIGVENKDGSEGLTVAFAPCHSTPCVVGSAVGSLPANGSTLRLDPAIVGGSSALHFTYQVEVTSSAGSTLTNVVEASDEGAAPVMVAQANVAIEYRIQLPVIIVK
jgi:uncharacterized repeat protein (TIGR01451 family)